MSRKTRVLSLVLVVLLCLTLALPVWASGEGTEVITLNVEETSLATDGNTEVDWDDLEDEHSFSSLKELKDKMSVHAGEGELFSLNYSESDEFVFDVDVTIPSNIVIFFDAAVTIPVGRTIINDGWIIIGNVGSNRGSFSIFDTVINYGDIQSVDTTLDGCLTNVGRLTVFEMGGGELFNINSCFRLGDVGNYSGTGVIRVPGIEDETLPEYLPGFDLDQFNKAHYYYGDIDLGLELWLPFAHTHTQTAVDEIPAGCEEDGTEAYWYCAECGKLFSDADGENEIEAPVTIPALGHSLTHIEAVEPTYEADGNIEYWYCERRE